MSNRARVRYAIASYLCKGRPCPHHLAEAERIDNTVRAAQELAREEEAKEALDRIVETVARKGA